MSVLRIQNLGIDCIKTLLQVHGLHVELVANQDDIPGSHWGGEEAGLIRDCLYVRLDTPIHSALHEACHWLLMCEARRENLHTNAGGTMMEENAVCLLQILLADSVAGMGRARMFSDMDEWGYSFRLGSAQAWFDHDAEDARAYLQDHRLAHEGMLNQVFDSLNLRPRQHAQEIAPS